MALKEYEKLKKTMSDTADTYEQSKGDLQDSSSAEASQKQMNAMKDNAATKKQSAVQNLSGNVSTKSASTADYSAGQGEDLDVNAMYEETINALLAEPLTMPTFESAYDEDIQKFYNQIVGREDFSYNVNEDALYKQIEEQYIKNGQAAMEDTIAKASAMTGGYGNSYAQSAGQQAYYNYLSELQDVIPELEQRAYERYADEGDELYNLLSASKAMRDSDYEEYQDELNKYYTDLGLLADYENQQYTREYQQNRDAVADKQWQTSFDESVRQWQEDFDYSKERDAVADEQWLEKFEYQKEQDDIDNALSERSMKLAERESQYSYDDSNDSDTENDEPVETTVEDYSDWSAGDWQGYFASIRQSEGKAAAEAELKYFLDNGLIPKNMVSYASIGARGQLGH